MSELHTAGWYTQKLSPKLPPEAFKPVPQRLWAGLIFLGLVIGSITTIGLFHLNLLAMAGVSVVIGLSFAGLGFLGHEILHGTVVKRAWLRDALGAIAFAQFNLGPKLWRKWHNMEHHAHTQDEHTDPDAMGTMEEFFQRPGLQFFYRFPQWVRSAITFGSFLGFFSVFSALMLKRYYKDFKPAERKVVLAQYFMPAAVWLALLPVLGPVKWFFAYLLPLALANFLVICYISTNHQLSPLVDVNDPLANSLTVLVPRWMDVINLNFSHHVEHHLLPGVNPKWGPLIRRHIKEMWPERYQEMPFGKALLTLWRTPRIYMDHTQLVDPMRGLKYGSLGNGLNPDRVQAQRFNPSMPETQATPIRTARSSIES